jgi:predicted ATP-grasp superfamily ATP-dependent carboligase
MADENELQQLNSPWMIAVWPGMGHVGINAGFYLASKLEMAAFAEFSPRELFDVERVDVQNGIIRPARLPRSRLFLWRDPAKKRDLVLFLGEAQPPTGKRDFCRGLIGLARRLGVQRVFTFAAMATQMHPEHVSRVYVASTDQQTLDEVALLDVQILREGHIGGLNGVLLGEAAELGLHGTCLLGEMPHIFSQLPFPAGSLAVLKVFQELTGIAIDLGELETQAHELSQQLGQLLARVEGEFKESEGEFPEDEVAEPEPEAPKLPPEHERRIEQLFAQARNDRSKAYELKQELDRLNVFADYEDRFLDLFQKSD